MNTIYKKYDVCDLETPLNIILALPFVIDDVELEIQYEISPYREATFNDPAEGGELEDFSYKVIKIGNFTPTDKQADMIETIIYDKEFKEFTKEWVWNDYADKKNEDDRDYAEYRYDMMNDR